MPEVTLSQMLDAREERVQLQKKLLTDYPCPLVCFTMNIAGPVKNSPVIERGFRFGITELESSIAPELVRCRKVDILPTGCQAMISVDMDAKDLKEICVAIEDKNCLGRLFDMDVIDIDGKKIERSTLRGCIICGAPGRACAAGRIHPVDELQAATNKIITEHFAEADAERFASCAVESLLNEVNTTPKPGLVDRRNSGSHKDMDINTFIKSALALKPYFKKCVCIGQQTKDISSGEVFPLLRSAGILAEKDMFRETDGINTHKGVIYSMGILCAALGRLWTVDVPVAKAEDILNQCSEIADAAVKSDFSSIDDSTAGGRLYKQMGITGIRGEVASGFASVTRISLPAYRNALQKGLSQNDAGANALLHLISWVEDTNLYQRGGADGASYAKDRVRSLLKSHPFPSEEQIELLDNDFISKNLSPGGCADLLAITYFIHSLYM